jgi:hypothetical protein
MVHIEVSLTMILDVARAIHEATCCIKQRLALQVDAVDRVEESGLARTLLRNDLRR